MDPERRLFEHNNIDKDYLYKQTSTLENDFLNIRFQIPDADAIIIEKYWRKEKANILKKLALKQKDNAFLDQFFGKILAKKMMKNGIG